MMTIIDWVCLTVVLVAGSVAAIGIVSEFTRARRRPNRPKASLRFY